MTMFTVERNLKYLITRSIGYLGLLTILLTAIGMMWLWHQMNRSIPKLNGVERSEFINSEVTIERDKNGVATVNAENRIDAAYATGFLHGQERFFQMDVLRRKAKGTLSELIGPQTIDSDKESRLHNFSHTATKAFENLNPTERKIVNAYSNGVNDGLSKLNGVPFEYSLLGEQPAPWQGSDSLVVIFSLYLTLQGRDYIDALTYRKLSANLPTELLNFLVPVGTEWDSAIDEGTVEAAGIPSHQLVDIRNGNSNLPKIADHVEIEFPVYGSNGWVLSRSLKDQITSSQTEQNNIAAILANDMHLPLQVPNIWYRLNINYGLDDSTNAIKENTRFIGGITLPGSPMIIAGSNKSIAWGFTNSMGDWSDLIELTTEESRNKIQAREEVIHVRGMDSVVVTIKDSEFGPIVEDSESENPIALKWVAHSQEAVNLKLLALENSKTVSQALPVLQSSGNPHMNAMVGDRDGNIGWTIMGKIPQREGMNWLPGTPSTQKPGWRWLPIQDYPEVINPQQGFIWTANARPVSGNSLEIIGKENYALGARAKQVRDYLSILYQADEQDMLKVQLDARAIFLTRWQQKLLEILNAETLVKHPQLTEYKHLVENWNGEATADSNGYLLVRAFRTQVARRIFTGILTAELGEQYNVMDYFALTSQWEGPLWEMVSSEPLHLLNPNYQSWQDLYLDSVKFLNDYLSQEHGALANAKWGMYNEVSIQHPLSNQYSYLHWIFDMPVFQSAGDINMPLVQEDNFGASMRMIVSPGLEEKGIFHMPVGQAGNPLTPYWSLGHTDWRVGSATPFMPEETHYSLKLIPDSK